VQRAVELAEAYYGAALLRPDSAQAQQIWGELIQLFTQNQPASGAAVQELEPARHRLEALAAQPHGPESDRQARQRKLLEDDYNRAWRQWWSTVSLRAAIDLDLIDLRRRNLPGAKIPLSHLEKQRLATLEQQYQQATADIEAAKQELDRLGKE
jgi:hypothetical protein